MFDSSATKNTRRISVLLNGANDRYLANLRLWLWLSSFTSSPMAFLDGDDESIRKINAIGNQSIVLLVIALKELKKGDHLVEHYTYWKE